MKSAIFADVHSNLEALERCVEHARASGVERYVCLGDCVGYGADPGPTLRLLMSLPGLVAVRGNHDEALFRDAGAMVPAGVREAIQWTRAQLDPAQRRFLSELPYEHVEDAATYVHASAYAPHRWEYLRLPEQISECLNAAHTPLVFFGHVHVPKIFYETAHGAIRELDPPSGLAVPLSHRSRYAIGVGSVGQPRDGNNATGYVVFDDTTFQVTFVRLAYDYLTTGAKIRAAQLDPSFAERLVRGR